MWMNGEKVPRWLPDHDLGMFGDPWEGDWEDEPAKEETEKETDVCKNQSN